MTNPIVYFAVAGAGKTYSICNSINIDKRNLILSFTHENISNVNKELIKSHGCIPENTIVMTFDYFLLSYFIWPYLQRIEKELFNMKKSCEKRVTLINLTFNPLNKSQSNKNKKQHYFIKNLNGDYNLILNNCAELVLSGLKFHDNKTLFDLGMERINLFFDCVYIDEFQDYRQSKYDLMCEMMKSLNEGYMYGDYYQNSVSGTNNYGRPFTKGMTYLKFKKELNKKGFRIDDSTLTKTRRCSENVCKFVREKFSINIYSDPAMKRTGEIKYVFDSTELREIIVKNNPTILYFNKSFFRKGITFGISKGSTYNNVIVIIPESSLAKNNGTKELVIIKEGQTKNGIYVALTRSTSNVYLTDKKTINEI